MFTRSSHRWVAVLTLLAAVAVLTLLAAVAVPLAPATGSATAATGKAAARAAYTPISGAHFNNAIGTEAQQNRIVDRMIRMTDATPAGAVIRVATLNFEMDGPADALLAAYERGVHVRIVMPARGPGERAGRPAGATLGGDVTAMSYLVKCTFGCLSPSTFSTMHTKMFLFGTVGDARRVLTVTTANLAPGQTRAWNDAVTVVGKRPLYAAAADYFDKMALDLPTKEFTKIASSRDFRLFLFPYPRKQGVRDYFTTSFKRIECRGVPRRAGRDGRTVVRLRSTIGATTGSTSPIGWSRCTGPGAMCGRRSTSSSPTRRSSRPSSGAGCRPATSLDRAATSSATGRRS